jgi:hypothetical protein
VISPLSLDDPLTPLRQPITGAARLSGDGVLTVGRLADGDPASLSLLADNGAARHATVVGAAGSGKTVLLRAALAAARTTGIDAQVIDAHEGSLAGRGFPVAASIAAARTVLAEQYELALQRQAIGGGPLRLLVIENLHLLTLDRDCAKMLALLAVEAGPARIAVIAGTQLAERRVFGPPAPHPSRSARLLLTQNLVLLRTSMCLSRVLPMLDDTPAGLSLPDFPSHLLDFPSHFTDEDTTAGIGYLPRHHMRPFRVWWS